MTKIVENDRIIGGIARRRWGWGIPMHFHDKDIVALFLEDGDLKSTTLDGQSIVNPHTHGEVRFSVRNRTHSEMLVQGKQHPIFTELKWFGYLVDYLGA